MPAHERDFLDPKQLPQSRLGAWRLALKCIRRPTAFTASVHEMAKRIEDLEAAYDEAMAERDRLALQLSGWEGGTAKKKRRRKRLSRR